MSPTQHLVSACTPTSCYKHIAASQLLHDFGDLNQIPLRAYVLSHLLNLICDTVARDFKFKYHIGTMDKTGSVQLLLNLLNTE